MIRLIALHEHLKTAQVVPPESMEISAEEGETEWAESTVGADMLLFRNSYQGVIEFSNVAGDLRDLQATVLVWLHDNIPDDEREDNQFLGWEGEPLDSTHSDLTFRFRFVEEVHYIEAPGYAGKDKVTLNGKDWQRGVLAADRATTLQDPVKGATA